MTSAPAMNLAAYVHHLRVECPPRPETATGARERLKEKFPRGSLRRMADLGMLLGVTLEGVALGPEDALVYATTYAETRALEDFLASFPTASPLGFQTSIHPSGVQQVFIGRQQPVSRLWPLAGRARLVEQAWLAALLEPAPRVVLLGGEEKGTWLLEQAIASDRAFAFAAILTRDAAGAVARMTFVPDAAAGRDEPCPSLPDFADALAGRRPLAWRGGGAWQLEWL